MEVWFWCLHCQRAFAENLPILHDPPAKCRYPGCDGHIGDILEWESVREHNPEYPETPAWGQEYPLEPDAPPSHFLPTDLELGENEFWCVGVEEVAKLLALSAERDRILVAAGKLTKIPYQGEELIPVPEIATVLGFTDREVLDKAVELELNLIMLGMF